MTPAKAIAAPRAGWLGPAALTELGELAVPIAVLGIVMALITPLPGFVHGPADRRRHPDVGDGDDGRRCTWCGRSSSVRFPPRCCC